MKVLVSLLALSAGAADAQRIDAPSRIEGDYESFQWGRGIHRTLRLDRDGGVEIVTEVNGAAEEDDRRKRDDYARYGWTAGEAARGRPVRQRGRWTVRDGGIELRLDAVRDRSGFATRGREDADLLRRGDGLVLVHAENLYGRDDVEFRPLREARPDDPVVVAPRPPAPRRVEYEGSVRLGDDLLIPQGIDFTEADGRGTLVVRTGKERIELRGNVETRDGVTTLRVEGDDVDRLFGRDGGTLTIVLEDGKVRSVRGTAKVGERRIEFGKPVGP